MQVWAGVALSKRYRRRLSMTKSPSSSGNGLENETQVYFGLPDIYVDIGAHIAHFFRGEDERLSVLLPFIQAGLDAGDQCCLVTEGSAAPMIQENLRGLGVDVAAAMTSGQLLVSDGGSNPQEMSLMFDTVISGAKMAGREVIRIGGDMTWALNKMPSSEKLLEWEAFYDKHVGPRAGFIALCQYDHTRFGGSAIMCALETHPLSIIGNVVQQNPFYRDPEEVLQELAKNTASSIGSPI